MEERKKRCEKVDSTRDARIIHESKEEERKGRRREGEREREREAIIMPTLSLSLSIINAKFASVFESEATQETVNGQGKS